MDNNVGKLCPYCRTPIGEADAVTVCPECGAAHHSACYEANGGCGARAYVPHASQAQAQQQTTVPQGFAQMPQSVPCRVCGAPTAPGQPFCQSCGSPLGAPMNMAPPVMNCPRCGTPVAMGQALCPTCGAGVMMGAVGANAQQSAPPKKKMRTAAKVWMIIGISVASFLTTVFLIGLIIGMSIPDSEYTYDDAVYELYMGDYEEAYELFASICEDDHALNYDNGEYGIDVLDTIAVIEDEELGDWEYHNLSNILSLVNNLDYEEREMIFTVYPVLERALEFNGTYSYTNGYDYSTGDAPDLDSDSILLIFDNGRVTEKIDYYNSAQRKNYDLYACYVGSGDYSFCIGEPTKSEKLEVRIVSRDTYTTELDVKYYYNDGTDYENWDMTFTKWY